MTQITITYARWTPHDLLECGEPSETGLAEFTGLRDLRIALHGLYLEPMDGDRAIYVPEYNRETREYFEEGIEETRTVHLDRLTPSSRRRVLCALGVDLGRVA